MQTFFVFHLWACLFYGFFKHAHAWFLSGFRSADVRRGFGRSSDALTSSSGAHRVQWSRVRCAYHRLNTKPNSLAGLPALLSWSCASRGGCWRLSGPPSSEGRPFIRAWQHKTRLFSRGAGRGVRRTWTPPFISRGKCLEFQVWSSTKRRASEGGFCCATGPAEVRITVRATKIAPAQDCLQLSRAWGPNGMHSREQDRFLRLESDSCSVNGRKGGAGSWRCDFWNLSLSVSQHLSVNTYIKHRALSLLSFFSLISLTYAHSLALILSLTSLRSSQRWH